MNDRGRHRPAGAQLGDRRLDLPLRLEVRDLVGVRLARDLRRHLLRGLRAAIGPDAQARLPDRGGTPAKDGKGTQNSAERKLHATAFSAFAVSTLSSSSFARTTSGPRA